jgi:hypothetical protein
MDLDQRRALVNGAPGVVTLRNGRPFSVMAFEIADDRIVAIDILADRERLAALDLRAVADNRWDQALISRATVRISGSMARRYRPRGGLQAPSTPEPSRKFSTPGCRPGIPRARCAPRRTIVRRYRMTSLKES